MTSAVPTSSARRGVERLTALAVDAGPTRLLLAGQVALFALMGSCCALEPAVVTKGEGFSNFGLDPVTVVAYWASFLLCAAAALAATATLPRVASRLRLALVILAVGLTAELLTTYLMNTAVGAIHQDTGIVLFAYQIAVATWLALTTRHRVVAAALVVQIAGSTVALLSIFLLNQMFLGEAVAEAGFGVALIVGVDRSVHPTGGSRLVADRALP